MSIVVGLMAACGGTQSESPSLGSTSEADSDKVNTLEFPDPTGTVRTYSDNAKIMLKPNKISGYPFFTSLGTNGRACIHCHTPQDAWGISAADVQFRFTHPLDVTNPTCLLTLASCPQDPNPANYGATDPIFRTVDGSNSPNADVSTPAARQAAFNMLLSKGLIRVGIGIPAGAEFTLAGVDDPYKFASAAQLSLFRRPLPATNLRLSPPSTNGNGKDAGAPTPVLTTVMWDGRETLPGHDILQDLMDQANGATLGHAQAIAGLSPSDLSGIVDFETGMHTAQDTDVNAGALTANGGNGGPDWLAANQPFYVGINDVLAGDYQTHAAFTPSVFTIYSAWAGAQNVYQASIARGEALFDTMPIAITGVGGLNDKLGIQVIQGSCTTCHDAPNYGHHSVAFPINIGIADGARRTPDLPLYTLQNIATGQTIQVTDPGRALVTGKWADIGKFKGPILRGLAARAPYFHNGSAATLGDVVNFYNQRFGIGLTTQQSQDLVAFLQAL
jgi:hypothetical protein